MIDKRLTMKTRSPLAYAVIALVLVAAGVSIPAYLWWQEEQTKKVWWLFHYDTDNKPNTILMRKKLGRYKTEEACRKDWESFLRKNPNLPDATHTLCSYVRPTRKPTHDGKEGSG